MNECMYVHMYYVPKYILFTDIVTIYTKPIITNEQIGRVFLYNFVLSLTSLDINNEKIREIDVQGLPSQRDTSNLSILAHLNVIKSTSLIILCTKHLHNSFCIHFDAF